MCLKENDERLCDSLASSEGILCREQPVENWLKGKLSSTVENNIA